MTDALGNILQGRRKASAALGDDTTLSRFIKVPVDEKHLRSKPKNRRLPGLDLPSIEQGRSLFHARGTKPVEELKTLLVSGHANMKIGRDVRKGKNFLGYWIYTLSLEERATCPRTCHHWQSCYGNNMPFAKRVSHADPDALMARLESEIRQLLAVRGRKGILIRLHALGDFFSAEYVKFWRKQLMLHDRLAVFGYTARKPYSEIGQEIIINKKFFAERFAVRWSDGEMRRDCTVSVNSHEDVPGDAFLCPEQSGKTRCCATCGACWNGRKNVAFLEH